MEELSEPLSDTEATVARLIAKGLTTREIAPLVYRSPGSVDHYRAEIIRKAGCRRHALLRWCIANFPCAGERLPHL